MKNFYRRNLPHWQPKEATYFVTICLDGSLPKEVVDRLKLERDREFTSIETKDQPFAKSKKTQVRRSIFKKIENILGKNENGPFWLRKESIARIVMGALHYRDQKEYDLYAYCIMPNHIHLVFRLLNSGVFAEGESLHPVTRILKSLKSYTGLRANRELERSGRFWQRESYDHVVRNDESLERVIKYTMYNPVKAKLVNDWRDWPYHYLKAEFKSDF